MSHVVTSWHAYKIDGSTAELTIIGERFGINPGAVKIIVQGGGSSYPQIKEWSDTVIVTEVPVDSTVKVVFVDLPDSKGKKDRSRTLPSEERASTGVTPEFNIASVTPSIDNLVVSGSNLALVEEVILYDLDAPKQTLVADFVEDAGDLIIEWPANFSGQLEKMRAIKAPDQVQEVVAPTGGWSPAEPGVVQWVGGSRTAGGDIIVTITGIDFGVNEGDVYLTKATGEVQAFVTSWTDTAIVVAAEPKTVYTGVRVVDAVGTEAEVAASTPLPFKTPGVLASISTVVQTGVNPEEFTISGSNLDHIASGELETTSGTLSFYSDDPAFYDTNAAANNTAGGVSALVISPSSIVVTATNDLSGHLAQNLVLRDLNGTVNKSLDFPDIYIQGLAGNAARIYTQIRYQAPNTPAFDNGRLVGLSITHSYTAAKHLVVTDKNSDAKLLPINTDPAFQNPFNLHAFTSVKGEKYTGPFDIVMQDDTVATFNGTKPSWVSIPGVAPTNISVASNASGQITISGDDLTTIGRAAVTFSDNVGTFIDAANAWNESHAQEVDLPFYQSSNAFYGLTVTPAEGAPDTYTLDFAVGGGAWGREVRGLYVKQILFYPIAGFQYTSSLWTAPTPTSVQVQA